MATDLRLISYPAQRNPYELAPQSPCHRLAQRGLSHAGRPDEKQNCACVPFPFVGEPALLAELADGKVFDNSFLHIVKPGVVGVEHRPGLVEIETILRRRSQRKVEHCVEPGANPGVFWRLLTHSLEAIDLSFDGLGHLLGQIPFLEFLPIVRGQAILFAKLLLDGIELLAKDVLLLAFLDALGCVVPDLATEFEVRKHLSHPLQEESQPVANVEGLEQLDFLLQCQVRGIDGEIGEL